MFTEWSKRLEYKKSQWIADQMNIAGQFDYV